MKEKNFNELQTTKLGTYAEELIINEFVTSKNYIPFIPSITNKSHPIDSICISGTSIWNLDVKCKPRRLYYEDTGIDLADYNSYLLLPNPTYILFLDSITKTIYGNWLHKFSTKIEGNIIYFPLEEMVKYRDLTEEEITNIKLYEESKYWKN